MENCQSYMHGSEDPSPCWLFCPLCDSEDANPGGFTFDVRTDDADATLPELNNENNDINCYVKKVPVATARCSTTDGDLISGGCSVTQHLQKSYPHQDENGTSWKCVGSEPGTQARALCSSDIDESYRQFVGNWTNTSLQVRASCVNSTRILGGGCSMDDLDDSDGSNGNPILMTQNEIVGNGWNCSVSEEGVNLTAWAVCYNFTKEAEDIETLNEG